MRDRLVSSAAWSIAARVRMHGVRNSTRGMSRAVILRGTTKQL